MSLFADLNASRCIIESLLCFRKCNMPLTLVVNIDVPDNIILQRISDRWIHPSSGRVYNMSYNRPKADGVDDITGEPLVRRPDDNPVWDLPHHCRKALTKFTCLGNVFSTVGGILRSHIFPSRLLQHPRHPGASFPHDFTTPSPSVLSSPSQARARYTLWSYIGWKLASPRQNGSTILCIEGTGFPDAAWPQWCHCCKWARCCQCLPP